MWGWRGRIPDAPKPPKAFLQSIARFSVHIPAVYIDLRLLLHCEPDCCNPCYAKICIVWDTLSQLVGIPLPPNPRLSLVTDSAANST